MTATSLRVGFLVSGLLHVAIVAAFTQSSRQPVPAVDEPRPLSLKLSAFRPPAPAPDIPSPPDSPSPEVAMPEPEPPPPVQPLPEPEPLPLETIVEASPPQPAPPKPVEEIKRKPKPKPLTRRVAKKKRPLKVQPPASTPVTVAAAVRTEPAVPAIDLQQRQHYLAALAAKINRNKYYPRASRRRGEEGTVVVRFVIQRGGALTDIGVAQSSGYQRLDKAALKTLRRVTPFKPIPDVIKRDRWQISVPIAFSLAG